MIVLENKVDKAEKALQRIQNGDYNDNDIIIIIASVCGNERNLARICGGFEAMRNWQKRILQDAFDAVRKETRA